MEVRVEVRVEVIHIQGAVGVSRLAGSMFQCSALKRRGPSRLAGHEDDERWWSVERERESRPKEVDYAGNTGQVGGRWTQD